MRENVNDQMIEECNSSSDTNKLPKQYTIKNEKKVLERPFIGIFIAQNSDQVPPFKLTSVCQLTVDNFRRCISTNERGGRKGGGKKGFKIPITKVLFVFLSTIWYSPFQSTNLRNSFEKFMKEWASPYVHSKVLATMSNGKLYQNDQ